MPHGATLRLLRSNGQSVFEFLYVDEAVEGLLAAASHPADITNIFHFGPGENSRTNVLDLVEKLSYLYDGRKPEISVNTSSSERTVIKYLDIRKAEKTFGWMSKMNLDDGLRLTIAWYRNNMDRITPAQSVTRN
jgi:nucleoside-diphosphate-sugar epimerase